MYKISPSMFSNQLFLFSHQYLFVDVFYYFWMCILQSPIIQLVLQLSIYQGHAVLCIMNITVCFLVGFVLSSFGELGSVMIS